MVQNIGVENIKIYVYYLWISYPQSMNFSSGSFWQSFLGSLQHIKEQNPIYYSIMSDLVPLESSNTTVVIGCSSVGSRNYMQKKQEEFESALSAFVKKPLSVVFVLNTTIGDKKESPAPLLTFEPTHEDILRKAGLRRGFTFEGFAVSQSNQVAFAAAKAVSKQVGLSYNPLFLYGPVGVGKTHLAQAVANEALSQDPSLSVIFCSGEKFMNELIESIRNKSTPVFRKKYRALSLIILDDVQFIAGKKTVQEEFFHTFNSVVSAGGQVVLTSDRPPSEIRNLEDRLRSRFSGGLIVDIQDPDFELRTAILLIKAREKNIDIDIESAKKIAERVVDTRALEGALLSLFAETLASKQPINNETVSLFFNKQGEKKKKVTPQEVIKAVCSFFGIKPSVLRGTSRKREIAFARQVAMFVLRNETGLGLKEIALLLKRKDHTTVLYGVDKIRSQMMKNPSTQKDVSAIVDSLLF